MDDVKLLPCPFCGSDAEIERGSDHHGAWFNLGCSRHWGRVPDPDKACLGGRLFYTETEKSETEAIAAWNHRTPAPDGRAEGLREAAEIAETFMGQWAAATYQNMDARMQNAAKTYAAGDIVSAILARAAEGDSHE